MDQSRQERLKPRLECAALPRVSLLAHGISV
jgi:hypothetical protein